jgi:hypothetical protein
MMGCEGDGGFMEMMAKMMEMMGGDKITEMSCSPEMIMEMMPQMMPHCLGMLLPVMSKEERTDFVLRMVATLMEHGCAGLSDAERRDFMAKLAEKIKA